MRLLGITIPENKNIEIGLTILYGIGRARSRKILDKAKIPYSKKPKEISTEEENLIRKEIEQTKLEGDLRREISQNVKRLKDIKSYRGSRHAKRLPVRGQRTKTNSRTVRGNVRKTMASGRRKTEKT
ncbi:MAG: 30S ribosomal protein S13 [Candidatus Paceibacterota bacterium]|jgi:small subunit ribosomal protein S13